MIICGIDPGLASGGLVLIESPANQVLRSYSLVEKRGAASQAKTEAKKFADRYGGWGDVQFTAAAARSAAWIDLVRQSLQEISKDFGRIDYFAIESFVDQPSRARQEKSGLLRNRWQTPLSMGRLAEELRLQDYSPEQGNVFYQNAGTVLRQWRTEISLLEQRKRGTDGTVVPGDKLVSNDHERKALVHALALAIRLEEKGNPEHKEALYSEESFNE